MIIAPIKSSKGSNFHMNFRFITKKGTKNELLPKVGKQKNSVIKKIIVCLCRNK